MFRRIIKISLKARLILLTACAVVALCIALFVAWRLARTTEIFITRQTESQLNAAALELARGLRDNPNGYVAIEKAEPQMADRRRPTRLPPHIENAFANYNEPLSRLTSIALHRFPETSGGFYNASENKFYGFASTVYAGERTEIIPSNILASIQSAASEAAKSDKAVSRNIQSGDKRFFIVAYPARNEINAGDKNIDSVWAMSAVANLSGVGDLPNIVALLALTFSVIAMSVLAIKTVKDLRQDVDGIESGLTGLSFDLNKPIEKPETPELASITDAINRLAIDLRDNIALQKKLESDLRQSERLSSLGRLVAGVAHEVRNPLAAIKLKIQMAKRGGYEGEKLDATFRVVTEEVERLDNIVRRLLEIGRAPAINKKLFNLCDLIDERAKLIKDVAARAKIELIVNRPSDNFIINGDEEKLTQVLDNLIQNAIESMPDGGLLTLSCETVSNAKSGGKTARITVDDTGHGIDEEDRAKIFEPFFTKRDDGTGLGLAIAREIVAAHDGQISFEERERGTRFIFELPFEEIRT